MAHVHIWKPISLRLINETRSLAEFPLSETSFKIRIQPQH